MYFLLLFISAVLLGCSTAGKSRPGGESITLLFNPKPGTQTETRYFNTSRVLTYSDAQLVKDRTESVDFTVASQVKKADEKENTLHISTTTVRKDGVVPLHDLAFPEKGEVLDYIVKTNGQVLKAGKFPPTSIFYVPSVPIPAGPVQVGDTWTLEHVWNSARDGIPLRLEIAAILKDIVTCEKTKKCADLEVSGHVNVMLQPNSPAKFESKIWGRMLFSLDRGDVIWSQTRSREEMAYGAERVSVNSCMISEMKDGANPRTKLECEPKEEAVLKVPSL